MPVDAAGDRNRANPTYNRSPMKVLVVGGGAREHALAWKLRQESGVSAVVTAPGNPGTAQLGPAYPVSATDIDGLVDLARSEGIDLTIVGPEAPLERGLADAFASEGLVLFGPTRQAARLETSKAFAKHLMGLAGVPTARYRVAETPEQAIAAVEELGGAVALKADGLAGGKGVIVTEEPEDALTAIEALMVHRKVGDAGRTLVVEERLQGPEVSFFAVADGDRAIALSSAQDHKRAFDDDRGPNTGGMGAFSPSPLLTPRPRGAGDARDRRSRDRRDEGRRRPVPRLPLRRPDADRRRSEGHRVQRPPRRSRGAGAAAAAARRSRRAADGGGLRRHPRRLPRRGERSAARRRRARARRGYPDHVHPGHPITGLDQAAALDDVLVFHGGTRKDKDRIVTAGGRVVTVVGRGADFPGGDRPRLRRRRRRSSSTACTSVATSAARRFGAVAS